MPDRVRWHAIPFAHGVQRRPTLQLRLKPRAAPTQGSTPPRTLQSVSRDTPGNTTGSTTRTLRSVSRDTPRALQSVSRDTPGNTAGSSTRTLRSVSRDTPGNTTGCRSRGA